MVTYNPLTTEESMIIEDKGTEAPFSGEYNDFFHDGAYLCRRCNSPLYESRDKFKSGCGWPSFDDEIPDAVKKMPDKDGRRVEILCANCGAHLGHVFLGENLTSKNTRHCVNSISLRFIPFEKLEDPRKAVFGGGCFWCLDAAYRLVPGVIDVVSGYAGGKSDNPRYEEVSGGQTGHAEVIMIAYDPKIISYEKLLEYFFTVHDPTTIDRQGNDAGKQYRSVIFYSSWKEKIEAENKIEELNKSRSFGSPIVTEVVPLIKFYPAEDYHQDYFSKNPSQAYCQNVIGPKLTELKSKIENSR
jgi:peptide methionine sulfoxide reductase msrA/msrB